MHHSHCTTMTGDGSLNMIWLAFEMKNTHKIKSVQCTQCDDCLSFDSHLDENQFCHLNRLNLNGSVLFNEMKSVSATNVTHTHTLETEIERDFSVVVKFPIEPHGIIRPSPNIITLKCEIEWVSPYRLYFRR